MIGDQDRRSRATPYRDLPEVGDPRAYDHGRGSSLRRFLGGSPVAVFIKLLFLSVLVGAAMAMLGLSPGQLFWRLYDTGRALIELGLDTFHEFGRWILAGAVVVVPLWLITRFLAMGK
ncbi:DUF6460 domain-containing protein [Methylobacterium gnaphalii]|uniref:DUF6460 domain-containing protein n=1 Tax=Methylobacterium gnaphalii TaxID=1010610 RepID=A0A512JKC4_9HYPH|nr:DUF6460 domain-containing protein [Methylobacterium gnaphalii]GEP10415.1 hypothetical protein MGN01_22600 [Methylobacterium gnaphalii]GJD71257.1 hypothetical protein MMMDOFMJ_4211 [Methylobacterium gnaphalii]GLS47753.1 hypothetical protein GCM10007885_05970 [Methylobacterium gnaphalii]